MGPVTISPGSSGALNFGYGIECSIFLELIRRVYRRLAGSPATRANDGPQHIRNASILTPERLHVLETAQGDMLGTVSAAVKAARSCQSEGLRSPQVPSSWRQGIIQSSRSLLY